MFVLKDEVKDLYIAMVRADVALAQAYDERTTTTVDDRKVYAYAFSLPFWVTMPSVLNDDGFYSLLDFVAAMDQIIAPDSMYEKLRVAYQYTMDVTVQNYPACVRKK